MRWSVVVATLALAGWFITYRRLQQEAAELAATQARLKDLAAQVATLRHDLRGILSPALLTADRLLTSTDPAVRRAGEVMVRTVERTTARLAETKLDPAAPPADLP